MFHDIEETAQFIRNAIRDLPKRFEMNEQTIDKLDDETQDLLHAIELGKIDAIHRQTMFRELKSVRQERRKLKDENEELRYIVPS